MNNIIDNPQKCTQEMEQKLMNLKGVRESTKKELKEIFNGVKDGSRSEKIKALFKKIEEESKSSGNYEGEPAGQHEGEVEAESRGHSGAKKSPSQLAHIECVNNWLRDLSQIV